MGIQGSDRALLCSVRTSLFALPLTHVLEIMRPLPVQPMPGSPAFVKGLAIVRGKPVAVVDLACVIDGEQGVPCRWVAVRAGTGSALIEVDRIVGIRPLPPEMLSGLPPLLKNADLQMVAAIGTLDAALLLVLDESRLIPDELVERLDRAAVEAGL